MGSRRQDIRNVAIIAHVDHGKTTLVDCMLRQSGEYRESQLVGERILDSNELERERGITILAKNIAVAHKGVKINLIDTPGHADFGGEVERVLGMADGALVLVDAAEGPMPQTRFVLSKAFECGLRPLVVVNKIDRPDARPYDVLNETFDLFLDLGADEETLDFPYVFASAKEGFASEEPEEQGDSIAPLLDRMVDFIPGPQTHEGEFTMLATTLDWSEFVGRIAVGRIHSGTVKKGQPVTVIQRDGQYNGKIGSVHIFDKLGRVEVEEAHAGDIVALVGLESIDIGDTICAVDTPKALRRLAVEEPTLQMVFGINTSPLAGREGKFLTTRHLRDRLNKELERNVALRVESIEGSEAFSVSGRGLLHLSVLIETMRREGFELSIGKPTVIMREVDGVKEEPYETLVVEVPPERFGSVMELVSLRKGQLEETGHRGDYQHLEFSIPARGLIGLRTKLLNATQGTAIIHHRFRGYGKIEADIPHRANGVLVSIGTGKAVAFGLDGLQERAELFIAPGDDIYEGMVVGENSRNNDMTVNPMKEKKLTNIRASRNDHNILLKPPRVQSLEEALEYIDEDELVEVTPSKIRLRKILLSENDRKRAARKGK
ncbi:Tyrosine phosphorylated protein A [Planctomycetales bacterium 10988]|nr:Tyrosine phosphorylated protein A [Planctomycetales bacterium 10988]